MVRVSWEGYSESAETEVRSAVLARLRLWGRIKDAGDAGFPVSLCDAEALRQLVIVGRARVAGKRVFWPGK